ncbi:hypothetical protein LCGC14_2793460, partial [marine sediment metagenome]
SWGTGVTVEDLQIGNPAGFDGERMLTVESVRCDLSPIYSAWTGRLKWMEVEGSRLDVVVREGDDGTEVNIAALAPLMEMPPPGRMAVRDAGATIHLPRNERLLELRVGDLQYVQGRLTRAGRLTMSAALAQEGGAAPMTLMSTLGGPSSAGGAEASFRFSNVDIAQLNLPGLLGLPPW